jgi:hypothetical protein
MSRAWSLALPVLTALVVAYALLVAAVPRPVLGARVYGGPTDGTSQLSLRIEAVQRDGEHESPYWNGPLSVRATTHDAAAQLAVSRVLGGVADFGLSFGTKIHGPVQLDARDASGLVLASGALSLDLEQWAGRARRRGGWIRGREAGGLVISIAPARGAFVVGATDPLLIRVERAGRGVVGARLSVRADGAQLADAEQLRTDEHGRAQVGFQASELNPTLRIEAHADEGSNGLLDTGVPVVPGGFHAVRTPTGIRVESATPRSEAYFSLVSDIRRVTGGALALASDGRGGSFATVDLPSVPHPGWVVVSSEVDQHSAAAIGWPLDVASEPAQTFDVADALLLDGLPAAFAREQARRSRVRWLTAAFIALAFALSVVILVLRVRAADRQIAQHLRSDLEGELAARIAPRGLLPLLVALLAIALGFVALGLIVVARSR